MLFVMVWCSDTFILAINRTPGLVKWRCHDSYQGIFAEHHDPRAT